MSTVEVTAAVASFVMAGPRDTTPVEGDGPQVHALVEAAKAGNRDAFGDLVTLHQQVVYRTALAALGDRADAEDVTQDALIVAWRKLPGFRGEAMFRTWLLTIVWRKAIDRRRQQQLWFRRTRVVHEDADAHVDPLDGLAIASPDPERTTLSRDMAERVSAEIRRLSPKLRDTLLLAAGGEHSYDEIAALLGVPLGTVKWRVAEARRILTQRLAGTR